MKYALLLMLCGCAANQSAFPMPPVFSPVEDAPFDVGHPGYVAPEPERSPHKRVLPETPDTRREAGIWAGDRPVATIRGPMVDVMGIGVPMPATFEGKANPAINCVSIVQSAADSTPSISAEYERLRIGDKLCAVTTVMYSCMTLMDQKNRERIMGTEPEHAEGYKIKHRDIQAVMARLYQHMSLVCSMEQATRLNPFARRWLSHVPLDP